MASNLGFDDGHPYLEEGKDEGVFFNEHLRVSVSDTTPPAAVNVTVERSIDGTSWEPVVETDDIASLIDWESWSYGDIQYRVTAFSAEGAAAVTVGIVPARSDALWLSGGVGLGVTGRLPHNPDVKVTAGRQRTMKRYAGRSLPVAYAGEAIARVFGISGTVVHESNESATVEQLERIAQLEQDRFMFRDPDGRRVYGTIEQVEMPRRIAHTDANADWGYSFTFTETEQR